MIRNVDIWFKSYLLRLLKLYQNKWNRRNEITHIIFGLCDHFEPYWNKANHQQAQKRVKRWRSEYPKIASGHYDCLGHTPKHSFFYPIEEYTRDMLDIIGEICHAGYGETEVHFHHDNDTAENLRKNLLQFIHLLTSEHGMLPISKSTNTTQYGFIHGNWALDNSRPDGRWCGINNEIEVLQQTGCYADFTMPSAPDITQTKIVNSIYYSIDDPQTPKSHNDGTLAEAGIENHEGLLCIQGPLCFNTYSRKFGIIPRIENGCLSADLPVTKSRLSLWRRQQIHVVGRPDVIFIKLYTHGTQERIMDYLLSQGGLHHLYTLLESYCNSSKSKLYYASARQMFNVVKGLEKNPNASPEDLLESELILSR